MQTSSSLSQSAVLRPVKYCSLGLAVLAGGGENYIRSKWSLPVALVSSYRNELCVILSLDFNFGSAADLHHTLFNAQFDEIEVETLIMSCT